MARYYEAVAEAMLPHVKDRPLSLVRCPEGLAGQCFYMKHYPMGSVPASLDQIPIKEKSKTGTTWSPTMPSGLVALAQLGVLEVHTWNSTRQHLEQPDRFVLDLDPGPEVKWAEVVETATLIRERLQALDLESFVKTTGGKGLHVVVPIEPVLDWDRCLELSRAIAGLIEAERPQRYTLNDAEGGPRGQDPDRLPSEQSGAAPRWPRFSTRAKPQATGVGAARLGRVDARADLGPVHREDRRPTAGVVESKTPGPNFFRKTQKLRPDLLRLAGKTRRPITGTRTAGACRGACANRPDAGSALASGKSGFTDNRARLGVEATRRALSRYYA